MFSTASKKSKRIILVVALCLAALLLTGCGASITVYDYTEKGVRYNMCELNIDADTVEKMERTAALDGDGNKYTVEQYFFTLFGDFGYTLVSASNTKQGYTVKYRKAVVGSGDLTSIGTAVEFTTTHTENPFIRTYTSVSENPFNGVRQNYDNVQPLHSSTVTERIKNGAVAYDENGEVVVSFPALEQAFPYLKGLNPDGLLLNYVRYGSDRMQSSGTKIKDGGGTAYMFSRYFDDTKSYIHYKYKRAVPYGWYITAIAAGALVLAVLLLVTRKGKKPTEQINSLSDGGEQPVLDLSETDEQTIEQSEKSDLGENNA